MAPENSHTRALDVLGPDCLALRGCVAIGLGESILAVERFCFAVLLLCFLCVVVVVASRERCNWYVDFCFAQAALALLRPPQK